MATIKVTDETFDQVVLKSEKPFVQRFTAEWCGPCKMIAPMLTTLMMNQILQLVLEFVESQR